MFGQLLRGLVPRLFVYDTILCRTGKQLTDFLAVKRNKLTFRVESIELWTKIQLMNPRVIICQN